MASLPSEVARSAVVPPLASWRETAAPPSASAPPAGVTKLPTSASVQRKPSQRRDLPIPSPSLPPRGGNTSHHRDVSPRFDPVPEVCVFLYYRFRSIGMVTANVGGIKVHGALISPRAPATLTGCCGRDLRCDSALSGCTASIPTRIDGMPWL